MITGVVDFKDIKEQLMTDSSINPVKILVLFISMTILSIFLDEIGFFSYLAAVTLKRSKNNQFLLFTYLYIIVSVLTIFTSNDIIILTFTPFICYFAKNAKISPIPYLLAEFIAANTWSMMLIIGNPTNIYLATANNISFTDYLLTMILPTIAAGATSFLILILIFKKKLSEKISHTDCSAEIKDKTLLIVGLIHLGLCTILLAISSYIGIEMWYISLGFVISLFIFITVISIVRKRKPIELSNCLKRAPWPLIPFVLSMFILIFALKANGITSFFTSLLDGNLMVYKYGFSSFFAANLINNIPMSVLFNSIIEPLTGAAKIQEMYAAIIGSNIGAFLTPIGALAGIMWSSILKKQHVKFSFMSFVKYGAPVAIPTIFSALTVLQLVT